MHAQPALNVLQNIRLGLPYIITHLPATHITDLLPSGTPYALKEDEINQEVYHEKNTDCFCTNLFVV